MVSLYSVSILSCKSSTVYIMHAVMYNSIQCRCLPVIANSQYRPTANFYSRYS